MSNKDLRYSEFPEDLMDSLAQLYKNEKANAVDECHMRQTAIAYASGELEPEENQKFRDHLHNCHFCLNLVLDVKVAESESGSSPDRPVTILPAVSKAFKKSESRNPFIFRIKAVPALISRSWSLLISPKMIAALATACLAFIIIYYGLNDSEVSKQFKEISKKIAVHKDEMTQPELSGSDFPPQKKVKTETPSSKSPEYSPKGKVDPFDPLFKFSQ